LADSSNDSVKAFSASSFSDKTQLLFVWPAKTACRVSVPFTEAHHYGTGERPNTELADNSSCVGRPALRIRITRNGSQNILV